MFKQTANKINQRSRMARILVFCINKLWLLLATVIILAALVHVALGLLIPNIDHYNHQITNWVKQNYGVMVEVEKLSAEWSIEGPSISLTNLVIKSPDGNYDLLQVKKVSVDVDLISSIIDRRISTANIRVLGADIQFDIDSNFGVVYSQQADAGANEIGLENISHELFDALFGQRRITIIDSILSLYTLSGTEFKYLIDELEVIKFDQIHQLFGRLSYSGGGDVTLVSEVYGDPRAQTSYSNVYLQGDKIDIATLPWINLPREYTPKSGLLSWQFWGTWREKHWQTAKASINLENAQLGQSSSQSNQLETMISWEHQERKEGYLALHNTQFKIADSYRKSEDSLGYFRRTQEQNIDWTLFVEKLELLPVSQYLQSTLESNSSISEFLDNTRLDANLENLTLSLSKYNSQWQPLSVDSDFSNLELSAWKSSPGVAKLNGSVSYSDGAGKISLSANDTSINMPELFRHSILVDHLASSASWKIDEANQVKFDLELLSFENKDFQLIASGALHYLDEQPIVNLYTELQDLNIANKSLYLPVGIMSDELTAYLDSSIKTGQLTLAQSFIRGPIKQFPFTSLDGRFVASGKVLEASYQYLPDWPTANKLNANLLFDGTTMDIVANQGESFGNQVNYARAFVQDLAQDNAILKITLDTLNKNNSGRKFLSNTPLTSIYQAIQDLDFSGTLNSHISLAIDLDNSENIKVDGQVKFDKDSSNLNTSIVNVENLAGNLKFNQSGILQSHLAADLFNQRLALTVNSGANEKEPVLSIDVKGKISGDGISHFIGQQWKPFFKGESDFSSLIQFSPSDKPGATRVLFQTDFKGTELLFPSQFGKAADTVSETYLTLDIAERSTGEIQWGELSGHWYWTELANNVEKPIGDAVKQNAAARQTINRLDYGGDFFIAKKAPAPSDLPAGLRVSGSLKEESLEDWLDFIAQLNTQESTNSDQEFELVFENIDLAVKKINTDVTSLQDANVRIKKLSLQPWQVAIKNAQIDGLLTLNQYAPWFAEIKRADLNIEVSDAGTNNETPSHVFSPMMLNDLDLKCVQCSFNQVDYGTLLAEVRTLPNGVSILGQMNKQQDHQIAVSTVWLETEDSLQETQLLVELNSDNIGRFLKQWELDATVEDSSGKVIANAWWQGAPWEMDYTVLDGDFELSLGKGYLSEISDQQGRLFSLFNLQSILRKLTFDFKDVYKKGFFYDSIDGTIRIRDGIVSTENVEIEGNVADVKLFGETNLRERTIDQTAVITPHLTSSFPVLAAWAVEPTTGLLVFLLDKIMEPAVEVATRLDYRISGTFDDVVVEEMKRSKKKIKVEYSSELPTEQQNEEDGKTETIDTNKIKDKELEVSNTQKKSLDNDIKSKENQQPEPEPEPEPEPDLFYFN